MDVLTLRIELDQALRRKVVNLRFKLLLNIGQGQYGKVLLAQDLSKAPRESYVAIKTIHRVDTARLITKTYLSHTTKIKREIQIMKECNHPNVVKLFQVIDDMKFDKILLVLEYCALGEIDWRKYNHYHEKYYKDASKRLTLNRILRDVTNGLEYLHVYKNIIHRDLKPSNLLISSDRTIKISDFGVSLILENNANDDRELGKTMGTPAFFAPELCQFVNNRLLLFNDNDLRRSRIDARIDVWSLGVTLYCLFYHQLPFEGFNEFDLFKNIVNAELRFPTTKRSSLAKPEDLEELALLEDLITRLLSKNPAARPTVSQIKAHGFTNCDLSKPEQEKFQNMNQQIVSSRSPVAAEAFASENKLTQRLRKLFISRSLNAQTPVLLSSSTGKFPLKTTLNKDYNPGHDPKTDFLDLEKVDDLLDSYLDDSSSFGSFDDDTEPHLMGESGIMGSLSGPPEPMHPDANNRNSLPGVLTPLAVVKSPPPPLKLSNSNFDIPKNKLSPLLKNTEKLRTPTSSHPVVTIGPDSPLSMKSVFSPSRRFFSKFKRRPPEPTLSALSGDLSDGSFTKLAPPPAFAGSREKPQSNRSSLASFDSAFGLSRKNSLSSNHSGVISKMSSSSSSLNLHAYLTDSPTFNSKSEGGRGTFDGSAGVVRNRDIAVAEDTESDEDDPDRTLSMDQYLDRLNG